MNAATLIVSGAIFLASPLIARELRRIIVSIASELKALKDDLAALKTAPATLATDLTPLTDEISVLSEKVAALSALVGTADELNPPVA